MTRLSSHNRQKSSKSPAGRKTQKSTVSFFWVLVIQMTYKAGNALTHIPRAQKCPKTRFLGGVIWTPNRPYTPHTGFHLCRRAPALVFALIHVKVPFLTPPLPDSSGPGGELLLEEETGRHQRAAPSSHKTTGIKMTAFIKIKQARISDQRRRRWFKTQGFYWLSALNG